MAMHVDFNEPQKTFDPAAIKTQQNGKAAMDIIAADAAAAKAHQDRASVNNAAALDIDAAEKAQQATDGIWGSTPAQSTSTALVPTVRESKMARILW